MSDVVIIGAGQGGFQAAASLRQDGHEGRITLIGNEPGLPYQRPPLSKAFLKGAEEATLLLRPASFYERNRIDYMPGVHVDSIDRAARRVHMGGESRGYNHLILAPGTRNIRPPIAGLDAALDLRTLKDAKRLREALSRPRRCAVIGGGFIGLEFAAVARSLGHEVVVAEAAPRLMARVLSPEMSERFRRMHEDMGTEIRLGQQVTEVRADGIVLGDGTVIAADLVLLAAGVVPNTELASAAGIDCSNGIVTDVQLRTSDPSISALGDCAVFPDPVNGRPVRLESVQAATDHARLISARLTGKSNDPYRAVPWFWSDQADLKLQIAGFAQSDDDSGAVRDDVVLRSKSGRVTAVETINAPKVHMKARRLLGTGEPVSPEAALSRLFEPVPG